MKSQDRRSISVVLPVYNGASTLEACVQSVMAAGERVAEIIIVDDGSTDDSLRTAEMLAAGDPAVKVIHTENHGCYAARNTGVRASSSDYIAFADVDDAYVEGALDLLADLLEEYDADIAVGGYREVRSLGEKVRKEEHPAVRSVSPERMWRRIMKWKTQEFVCYVWNKLYKRELLEDLIAAEGINQGEDVLITCQAFIGAERIVETAYPVYLYVQNPESLTRDGFGKSDLNLLRVWDSIVEIMKKRRPDLLPMAQFNRRRTDFTLITRLILTDNKELDQKYASELKKWRRSLKKHWKELIKPHAMPFNRELLVIGLRFFYLPTKLLLRLGRKLTKEKTSVILHSGERR